MIDDEVRSTETPVANDGLSAATKSNSKDLSEEMKAVNAQTRAKGELRNFLNFKDNPQAGLGSDTASTGLGQPTFFDPSEDPAIRPHP